MKRSIKAEVSFMYCCGVVGYMKLKIFYLHEQKAFLHKQQF